MIKWILLESGQTYLNVETGHTIQVSANDHIIRYSNADVTDYIIYCGDDYLVKFRRLGTLLGVLNLKEQK